MVFIVISFIITKLIIINNLYYLLWLPLSFLIFLGYWQKNFDLFFLLGIVVISHLMIIKFSYGPSLHKTLLLTVRINYVGHNYYFIKIGLKEYFLSSTLSFQFGDKITFFGYVDNLMPAPNIYQFDFSKYLENNGIYYAIKVKFKKSLI